MYCSEYKYLSTKYDANGEVEYFLIYVELYGSTVTESPPPSNALNIDDFPEAYDPLLVKFSPGSVLYYVTDQKLYIADIDNTFVEQDFNDGSSDLPPVTGSDNGDVLGVVSGVWAKSALKTINSQSLLGSGNIDVSGLPAVTSTDNGKLLGVDNGDWTKVNGLPPVTSSDNGKALTVVDGAWAASEMDYVVTITKPSSAYVSDRTALEIQDAIDAGKRVCVMIAGGLVTSDSSVRAFTLIAPLAGSIGYNHVFSAAYRSQTQTVELSVVVKFNASLQTKVDVYSRTYNAAPEPLVVTYTITGQPIGNTYPLSTATSYASIVAALTAGREVVAVLTSGAQELRMRLVSMNSDPSTGYVAFSAVTEHIASPGTLALYQIVHTVDESTIGLIVPLITGTMTYNSSTNTLDISGV